MRIIFGRKNLQGTNMIAIKRVYEPYAKEDGQRILTDRLWPRGLTKEKAHVDLWLKDIAPTTELRKWFNHEPEKWLEFQKRYRAELTANKAAVATLREWVDKGQISLVYGAKDEAHNEAVVIKEYLRNK